LGVKIQYLLLMTNAGVRFPDSTPTYRINTP